jgi:hypothetical protein
MSYLAEALYAGKGLPERGETGAVFAPMAFDQSAAREWGLFFDHTIPRPRD